MEVPFRWTPGQIEIQVSFDGREPIWCILDSGAEFSMLDAAVAEALFPGRAVQRGGRERIEDVTWKIGPLTMTGQKLTLWPLDNFRRQKRDIRGVIGCELFERYVVTIDYQKRVIILNEPSAFRPDASASEFRLTFDGRLPVIPAKLKFGQKSVAARLMIDTGASQAVILRFPFATEHHLFGPLSAEELTLGSWTFPNPAVKAYGSPKGAGGYKSTDGLLGNDVLQHFQVTFDYSRKRIFLEKTR
jgi:hypothetical protein